mmetsp:Transcript_103558/g.333928  ORF Transcript_103558/g.333928 Transcript_103558/m.333928 type:complete len:358 (+) Transcript_103558:173-1246(+)
MGESSSPGTTLNSSRTRCKNFFTTMSFSLASREVVQYTISPPGRTRSPAQRRSSSASSALVCTVRGLHSHMLLLTRFRWPPTFTLCCLAIRRRALHGTSTKTLSKGPSLCSAGGTLCQASEAVRTTGPPLAMSSAGRKEASTSFSSSPRTRSGSLQTRRPWAAGASPAASPAAWLRSAEAITRAFAPGPAQRSSTASPGCGSSAKAANAEAPLMKQHGSSGNGASGLARRAAAGRGRVPSSSSTTTAATRKSCAFRSAGGRWGQARTNGISSWSASSWSALVRSCASAGRKGLTRATCVTASRRASSMRPQRSRPCTASSFWNHWASFAPRSSSPFTRDSTGMAPAAAAGAQLTAMT